MASLSYGNLNLGDLSRVPIRTLTLSDLNTTKSILITSTVAVLACLAAISQTHHLSSQDKTSAKDTDDDNDQDEVDNSPNTLKSFLLFCYSCFLKPHAKAGTTGTQQDALESFYGSQAGIYDATRGTLLKGREDMLALVAAQLQLRYGPGPGPGLNLEEEDEGQDGGATKAETGIRTKPVWVDVGGGTGWNIEAMAQFVDVPEFFKSVYLVDFSPSLCEVARKRFARLGWGNVKVVCMDARKFRLEDYEDLDEDSVSERSGPSSPSLSSWWEETSGKKSGHKGAELITMSYSLSMMVSSLIKIAVVGSRLTYDGVIAGFLLDH